MFGVVKQHYRMVLSPSDILKLVLRLILISPLEAQPWAEGYELHS